MKKYLTLGCLVMCLGLLSVGCANFTTPVLPPYGWTFNETTAPIDITFDSTEIGAKSGMAEAASVLGLVAWGDCSQQAAARAGNIQEITHLDVEIFNVLNVYTRYTTIAYGN